MPLCHRGALHHKGREIFKEHRETVRSGICLIGAPELAEDIYLSLDWGNEHSSVSDDPDYDRALTELREAMDADDADGTVLRYCMLVLRYQYR
ncbi:MAG: hypothetical protein IKD81_01550 [Eubacteriaceae bacterium]|nr:hypothetical protein [Eubacteriaceae bacterium]